MRALVYQGPGRQAYQDAPVGPGSAIGSSCRTPPSVERFRVATVLGGHAVPNDVNWLRSELVKTRGAYGCCSRDLTAEARA